MKVVVGANESRVIGSRISSGIAAKKKREGENFKWGFEVHGAAHRASAAGVAVNQTRALASAKRIVAAVTYLESQSITQRNAQLDELEKMNVTTARGKKVSRTTIHRAFQTVAQQSA